MAALTASKVKICGGMFGGGMLGGGMPGGIDMHSHNRQGAEPGGMPDHPVDENFVRPGLACRIICSASCHVAATIGHESHYPGCTAARCHQC